MEGLTKENFWNEMVEKYPLAMEKFSSWIDQYKKDNNWKALFTNHDCECPSDYDSTIDLSPKVHNLPLAFQVGIFNQFCAEQEMDKSEYRSMQSKIIERFLVYQNE